MRPLGSSGVDVFPLCLGGNVFGWTADEPASFAVLDAYAAAGGNFIDTAAGYSAWVPGNSGGESETIIGNWTSSRGNRESVVIGTKIAPNPRLTRDAVLAGAEASLRRLRSDYIDLFYIHHDDRETPLEETLGAFGELVAAGQVRHVGVSNFSRERLELALEVVEREGLPPIVALQNEQNLLRREYEDGPLEVAQRAGIAAVPYYALASGFLTGKYRRGGAAIDSPRAQGVSQFMDDRGFAVLDALDAVAAAHDTSVSAVALAWLLAQPTVVAPIASARSVEQLEDLLAFTELELSAAELDSLSHAG
ncbi:MAG TPA: aldo/keto reductase [Solirubrobacteraceae bacterium]|nr:aldo/keto reductase [Solirubrobacteraceae bacterium]